MSIRSRYPSLEFLRRRRESGASRLLPDVPLDVEECVLSSLAGRIGPVSYTDMAAIEGVSRETMRRVEADLLRKARSKMVGD